MQKSALFIPCTLLFSSALFMQCDPEITGTEVSESVWAIQECHTNDEEAYDDLEEDILGTWKWLYTTCPASGNPEAVADYTNDNTLVTFREDGTVTLQTDSSSQSTTYAFVLSQGYTSPQIEFEESLGLWGGLYMCKDEIAFISSPVDGCDQQLVKQE